MGLQVGRPKGYTGPDTGWHSELESQHQAISSVGQKPSDVVCNYMSYIILESYIILLIYFLSDIFIYMLLLLLLLLVLVLVLLLLLFLNSN